MSVMPWVMMSVKVASLGSVMVLAAVVLRKDSVVSSRGSRTRGFGETRAMRKGVRKRRRIFDCWRRGGGGKVRSRFVTVFRCKQSKENQYYTLPELQRYIESTNPHSASLMRINQSHQTRVG